jgi:hypothetical protein
VKLADSLGLLLEAKRPDDPLVQEILAGKSPRARAAELISSSRLSDTAYRREVANGGSKAVADADDPMIRVVRLVDAPARQLRQVYEQQVEEPLRQAYGKIAEERFKAFGANEYPDATGTLRLAYGTVVGYTEDGKQVPAWTTLGGAYEHSQAHGGIYPFRLPQSWVARKGDLRLDTPFNFVCTADIIGGNSGSPVVSRDGELVGIVFDSNIYGLVSEFMYADGIARAVSVHSSAVIEALNNVYGAKELVSELSLDRR